MAGSIAQEVVGRAAALAKGIVLSLGITAENGHLDPSRVLRADSREVMAGMANTILSCARLIADRTGRPADRVVALLFAAADGSLGDGPASL